MYWIVPAGLVVLFYYGRHHFNAPDYALAAPGETGPEVLPWNAPASKLRSLAPPIFTTSRTQYRRYALFYIGFLQVAFLTFTCFPDLIVYAAKIYNFPINLSAYAQQRGIWALFFLTGFLSSFPIAKEIDAKIRLFLHRSADIPDGAELMASTLFKADFAPDQHVRTEIVRDFKTKHMRWVAMNEEQGALERKWLEARCLQAELQKMLANPRCAHIRRTMKSDADEIDLLIARLRERLTEYYLRQDRLIPDCTPDLDEFMSDRDTDEDIAQLKAKRTTFVFEVDALFFRMCRFATVLIYATEPRPEAMNKILNDLGFVVKVTYVPPWDLDAIVKVSAGIMAALLVPSLVYAIAISHFEVQVPPALAVYVPTTGPQVLAWAITGVFVYLAAVALAVRIKRGYARSAAMGISRDHPQNVVIGIACYTALLAYLLLAAVAFGGPPSAAFLWALLPAITGYYVGKYIDKAVLGKTLSLLRPLKQATIMCVTAALTCFTISDTPDPSKWPAVFVYFTVFAAATVGLVGFTVGFLFQYLYSHKEFAASARISPELAEQVGRRVVGDFILERAVPV